MNVPTDRVASAAVLLPADGSIRSLVAPLEPDVVFTAAERRDCAASMERLAGRLAAKLAIRDLLDLPASGPLTELAVVPGRHEADGPCRGMHRPEVVLTGAAAVVGRGRQIVVSISHVRTLAIAICAVADEGQETP